jgi:ABC-2 type transport system permease protein
VRWLLVKDLQILRRSPLLVALLVAYPVVLSILIGLALSGGPDKPRVAFVNLVPPGAAEVDIGGERVDASRYADELFESVEPIRVDSRAEAIRKVRDGDALAALIIPADATQRLQGALALSGGDRPTIEVIYNAEDPVKRRFVEATIESRLADANKAISDIVLREASRYLQVIVAGGKIAVPIAGDVDILGLQRTRTIIGSVAARLPPDSPERIALGQVERFSRLAAENLDVSRPILATIGSPVRVRQTVIEGSSTPLDAFAVAVSVTISLMFVTLLLASGMLALEREEHTVGRLVRGLVSRTGLLVEKGLLAALCSTLVTLAMAAGLAAFVGLDWSRAPWWLLALGAGAAAFAAMGLALGALAREIRAASLLAFLLSLPIAFLALVPSGAVSDRLYDVIAGVSAAFPFKPALRALDGALNGGDVLEHVAHLGLLTLAFGVIARLALRRFA